jgi:hypothetical protein
MNFNPQNEEGLLGLIAALKNGMDPNTAYGVMQNIQGDQAGQIAQRQERLGGLAEMLSGTAMQGMPYSGASALAEAAPGPAGPAVQQMLQSLYPGGSDTPPMNAGGQVMDFPQGSRQQYVPGPGSQGTGGGGVYAGPMTSGPQAVSPTYQPPQPSPTEQIAMQQQEQGQQFQQAYSQLAFDAQNYVRDGKTREQFMLDAAQAYPELFAADIKTVQQIVLSIFPATGA